jgi:rhamnosyltransferase
MTFPISCVVVFFQPTNAVLQLVETLASGGYGVVVVVNGASDSILRALGSSESVAVIDNKANLGLAKALNIGIRHAFQNNHSDFVALFDQDSVPDASLPRLLADELDSAGPARLACIGPQLIDRKDREARYASNLNAASADRARSIPTSGTVISRGAYAAVGPMMEELFIDGIDHEWCLRACSKGYAVRVSAQVQMVHDMGDASLNYFGRYKPVHRSPIRHYYIVRNTIYLARFAYLPLAWRVGELVKTFRRVIAYLLFSSDRPRTARLIVRAIGDGVKGRMGAWAGP